MVTRRPDCRSHRPVEVTGLLKSPACRSHRPVEVTGDDAFAAPREAPHFCLSQVSSVGAASAPPQWLARNARSCCGKPGVWQAGGVAGRGCGPAWAIGLTPWRHARSPWRLVQQSPHACRSRYSAGAFVTAGRQYRPPERSAPPTRFGFGFGFGLGLGLAWALARSGRIVSTPGGCRGSPRSSSPGPMCFRHRLQPFNCIASGGNLQKV